MNPSLNQLDSPTEADQLQMLLEMKTKECEVMYGQIKDFDLLERKYIADIRSGQENLNYAIEENEKIRSELEQVKAQLKDCKLLKRCQHCSEQQLLSDKVLCRGAVDRSIPIEASNEQGATLREMEKQVEALTLDKKQLMTHVHWLAHELRSKDERLKNITHMVSGYSTDITTEDLTTRQTSQWLQDESSSLEEGTKKLSCIPALDYETADVAVQTGYEMQSGCSEHFRDRVNRLKVSMLTLRAALLDNVTLADSIQHSAVQSVRHPFEPRLYSEMSSIDVSSLSRSSSDIKKFPPHSRISHFTRYARQGPSRQSSLPRGIDDIDVDSRSPSVYHSTVASPQDGTDDDSDLYLLRGSRLAPRRTFYDGLCKGESQHTSDVVLNGSQCEDYKPFHYRKSSDDLLNDFSPNKSTSHEETFLGGSELYGYVAGRLRESYGDFDPRRERINRGSDVGASIHAMSLAVFPTQDDSVHRSAQSRDGSI